MSIRKSDCSLCKASLVKTGFAVRHAETVVGWVCTKCDKYTEVDFEREWRRRIMRTTTLAYVLMLYGLLSFAVITVAVFVKFSADPVSIIALLVGYTFAFATEAGGLWLYRTGTRAKKSLNVDIVITGNESLQISTANMAWFLAMEGAVGSEAMKSVAESVNDFNPKAGISAKLNTTFNLVVLAAASGMRNEGYKFLAFVPVYRGLTEFKWLYLDPAAESLEVGKLPAKIPHEAIYQVQLLGEKFDNQTRELLARIIDFIDLLNSRGGSAQPITDDEYRIEPAIRLSPRSVCCPRCGFQYGWNGHWCNHCGHVNK